MKRALALLALVSLLLVGCVRIPSSGPVTAAETGDMQDRAGVEFIAEPPGTGASPEAIILGFLYAGVSPENDYEVAREYLTDSASTLWDPVANVRVRSGAPQVSMTDENSGEVAVTLTSRVDTSGIMHRVEESTQTLSFSLTQVEGEWRLDEVPEGILVSSLHFEELFEAVSVRWFTTDGDYFVPDLRWFPDDPQTLTRDIVDALLEGPASWLQSSVLPSAAAGAELVGDIADRPGGGLSLTLSSARPGSVTTQELSRFALQVQRSTGAGTVEVHVSGADDAIGLSSEAEAPSIDSLWSNPLVYRDGEVRVAQTDGALITGLGEQLQELSATSFALVPGTDSPRVGAAYARGGGIHWLDGNAVRQIGEDAATDPSVDRFRTVWWVDNSDEQLVHTWVDGEHNAFSVELGGESVFSVEISPEGSRLAVITGGQGNATVRLFAVVRSGAAPEDLRLGPEISAPGGIPVDVTWTSQDALAVVSAEEEETAVRLLSLDGTFESLNPPSGGIVEVALDPGGGIRALEEGGTVFEMAPGRTTSLQITDIEFLIS
ncbi:LpqB family beta-propeller domain-containing protein [uncultured Agrococcus sp.]|uniref:LpqB family beta-propeller domain-containing protein n=1 Tax=uncultured Agrococcus sp. TaxID=382258 RepID=UPI0025CBDD03|nr:LpqB family beta-propeller domain-containing protein [uncultured Agrococcus sp.]